MFISSGSIFTKYIEIDNIVKLRLVDENINTTEVWQNINNKVRKITGSIVQARYIWVHAG